LLKSFNKVFKNLNNLLNDRNTHLIDKEREKTQLSSQLRELKQGFENKLDSMELQLKLSEEKLCKLKEEFDDKIFKINELLIVFSKTKILNQNVLQKIIELFSIKNIFKINNKVEKIFSNIVEGIRKNKRMIKDKTNKKIQEAIKEILQEKQVIKEELLQERQKVKQAKQKVKLEKQIQNVQIKQIEKKKIKIGILGKNIQDKTVENENNIKYIKSIQDDLEKTENKYKELIIETNFLKLIPRQTNYVSQQIIENHLKIVLKKLITENAKEKNR